MRTLMLLLMLMLALGVQAQQTPPSTPGVINSLVTQDNIQDTICSSGWTAKVRPPSSFTNWLKLHQLMALSLSTSSPRDYEEDHRVPLEVGGHPLDQDNLWPEPWAAPYGAHQKDKLENAVHKDVCARRLTLEAGRAIFLGDWWVEYKRRYEGK